MSLSAKWRGWRKKGGKPDRKPVLSPKQVVILTSLTLWGEKNEGASGIQFGGDLNKI